MTCSKNFGRLLQVGCLGLIGTLTLVGCGGSESKPATTDGSAGQGETSPLTKPNLNANPATVSVGSVDVGKVSTAATVTITNNGNAAGALTVTPSGVGIAASGCTGTLAINTPCTLSITAAPSAAGAIVGTVTVSAAGGNTVTIGVSGTGTLPGNFTLTPTAIALGDVAVGATVQATLVVTANAAISGLTTGVQGADLKVDASSDCTGTLAAGASCNVVVNFSSTTVGSPTSDAIVVGQGGVTKSVPVTANVLAPAKLAATPTAGSLVAVPGSVSTTNLDVNIGNIGGMTTGTLAVAIVGADFKVLSENCSIVTLASSKYCTVTVQYAPAATATATETASLTVTDKGAGASVATVALTGTPNPPSTLTLTGTAALGSVAPGSSGAEVLFTVTNTAATPSGAISAVVAPSANITISSNACAAKATLAQSETCTIGLKLTPAASATAQAVSATLTVTGATAKAPVSVVVTGAILSGATLSAAPTSVSFGSVPVNQSSSVQSVVIKNNGATATGALQVTLSGTGAAQVATTSNTCTGTLAPAATCAVAVQYSPTDTTGVNGIVTVTDGASSVSVAMVGTGLAPSVLTVSPTKLDFGSVVVGYSAETTTLTTATDQVLVVGLITTATTDSGDISTILSGDGATDFAISDKNTTCTSIQPGQTCIISVTFTPSAVGDRIASLTVTGSKGGTYTIGLKGTGLALVQLIPLAADSTATSPVTGLDFGMTPNGTAGKKQQYRAVVRGATDPAATSTVATIGLVAGTPPDFTYVTSAGVLTTVNPCNGVKLPLPVAGTAAPWVLNKKTPNDPGAGGTTDEQATNGFWTCDFWVQFSPQTGKNLTTPKTATINASVTGSADASLTLTGIASGPLTINPSAPTFSKTIAVGTDISLSATLDIVTLTVANEGIAGGQGKLTVALGGTNAADFAVIVDNCSGQTLTPSTTCTINVGFAPTSVGTKTATITVTAAGTGETATATITGSANQPAGISIAPTAVLPARVDLGPVAQANVGTWTTFTISNPAAGALTGKLNYSLTTGTNFQIFDLTNSGATSYPAGSCGAANTKQLNPGDTCTIQVRFAPRATSAPSATTPRVDTLTVTDVDNSVSLSVPLKGTATPQLALSGAAISLDVNGAQTVDFGSVATGVGTSKTITVTNNGAAVGTVGVLDATSVTLALTLPAHFTFGNDGSAAGTCINGTALAGSKSCQMTIVYTGVSSLGKETPDPVVIQNGTSTTVTVSVNLVATSVSPAVLALYGFGDYVAATLADVIDLGSAPLSTSTGPLSLWFTNTGGVAATGITTSFTQTGTQFSIVAEAPGTCSSVGGILNPGDTCSVNVQFTPTSATGLQTATLNFFGTAIAAVPVRLQATGITTSNSVYAFPVGGTNSFYTFAGTTSITSTTGTKAYFKLQNNLPAGANAAANTLSLGTNTDGTFTTGTVDLVEVAGIGGRPGDFLLKKETDGTSGVACGNTLAPGAYCIFSVTFKPLLWEGTTTLYRWASVAITHHLVVSGTGIGNGDILGLFGQVQKPALLQLSATSTAAVAVTTQSSTAFTADFGQLLSGQTPSLTFTIKNVGEAATVGAPTLTLNATTFAAIASSTCGSTPLAAGATCTVTVNSQLTSTIGQQTAITVNATDGTVTQETSLETFTLKASVVNPASLIVPAPSTTAFASTSAGASATPITITVTNGSGSDSTLNRQSSGALSVNLSDKTNFAVDPTSTCLNTDGTYKALPISTSASGSCTIIIDFNPLTAGSMSTTVSVTAAHGGTPAGVTLTGKGLSDLSVSPTTSPLPVTTSQVITVTNNNATVATALLRESITGTNAAAFVISADTCYGTTVDAAGHCTVTVEFVGTPSTTTAQTATLTVTDGSPNNTVTVALTNGGPAT